MSAYVIARLTRRLSPDREGHTWQHLATNLMGGHMANHDSSATKDKHGNTIAALFQSREEARATIKPLHKSHYTHTWLGTTGIGESSTGQPVATIETGGFFAGTESLVDALVKRGVHGDAARSLTTYIEPGNAVLTVDPKDHDTQEAIVILERHGGQVAVGDQPDWKAWPPASEFLTTPQDLEDVTYEELVFTRR